MKRLLMTILAALLVCGFTGPALACHDVGGLTVSLYKSDDADVGYEAMVDLVTLSAGSAVTVNVDLRGFTTTQWSQVNAGAFGYSGVANDRVFFATTQPTAPTVVSSSWSAFLGADDVAKLHYRTIGANPAKGLALDPGSYWVKMDSGTTPGQYAGLNADIVDGEANLAALQGGGSVTMYLYKFRRSGRDVLLVPGAGADYWATLTISNTGDVLESPVIAPITNKVVVEGTPFSFTPTLSQGAPAVWSLDAGPAGMVINSSSGQITWDSPVLGVHTVEISADNAPETACPGTATFKVTVNAAGPCAAPASTVGTKAAPKAIPFLFLALVPVAALLALRIGKRSA